MIYISRLAFQAKRKRESGKEMSKSGKKARGAKAKTKRVTGQSKKEPHFHPTFKVISLLGVIILFLIAMVFLTGWRTQKHKITSEMNSVRHEAEVKLNRLSYRYEQDMKDIQDEKEELKSHIDGIKVQIEMAKSQITKTIEP